MGGNLSMPDPFQDEASIHSQLVADFGQNKAETFSKNLPHLRFICRLRGLPSQLSGPLRQHIASPETNIEDKIVAAQVLKYAFLHNKKFASVTNVLELLLINSSKKDDANIGFKLLELKSEICLILCRNASQMLLEILPHIKELVSANNIQLSSSDREEFVQYLQTCRLNETETSSNVPRISPDLPPGTQSDFPVNCSNFASQGALDKVKSSGKQVKPHAVKVQQQSTSKIQENSSQETNLAQVSLAKALNARTKSIQHDFKKEVIPSKEDSKTGSDTSWYRTTFYEVKSLLELAEGGKTISNDDQKYLFGKIEGSHYTFSERSTILDMVVKALYHISKRQRLQKSNVEGLAQQLDVGNGVTFHEYVLKIVQRCAARDSSYFNSFIQKELKSFMASSDCTSDHKDIIFDTFAQMSGTAEATLEIFQVAMSKLENSEMSEIQKDTALRYVSLQSLNEKQVKLLFNSDLVDKLCSISLNNSATSTFKTALLEILENYLDHNFSVGLTPGYLIKLLTLEAEERTADFQLQIVRVVLKTLNKGKKSSKRRDILEKLATMSFLSQKTKVMVVVFLHDESIKSRIANAYLLSPLLLEEGKASLEDEEDGTDDNANFLSALVASILLNSWANMWIQGKSCGSSPSSIQNIITSVEQSKDIQTRIRCSKILRGLAEWENLNDDEIKAINSFTADSSGEIRLQCKCAVVKGIHKLSNGSSYSHIDSELLAMVASHFSFNQQLLDGADFSPQINHSIINTLQIEAKKKGVEFGREVWSMVYAILDPANGSNSGGQSFVEHVLKSVESYSQNGKSVSSDVLDSIERFLKEETSTSCKIVENIFKHLVQNGNSVTHFVLEYFSKMLLALEDRGMHDDIYNLLNSANVNQDLPENIFSIMWMETCFTNLKSSLAILTKVTSTVTSWFGGSDNKEQRLNHVWQELEQLLQKRSTCSKYGMQIFSKFASVSQNNDSEYLIKCLSIVSRKGQSILKEVLDNLANSLTPQAISLVLDPFLDLCCSLLHNNQEIPVKLSGIIFTKFEGDEKYEIFLDFISLWVERGHKVSRKTVSKLTRHFENCIKMKNDELIATSLSILVSAAVHEKSYALLPVFFSIFQEKSLTHLIPLGVNGICHILKSNKKDKQFDLNDNQINNLIESLQHLNAENCSVVKSLLRANYTLTNEQRWNMDLVSLQQLTLDQDFLAALHSHVISEPNFTKIFDKKCTQRLLLLLNTFTNNEEKAKVLQILSQWLQVHKENKDYLLKNFELNEILISVVKVFAEAVNNDRETMPNICITILQTEIFYTSNCFASNEVLQNLENIYPKSKFIIERLDPQTIPSGIKFLRKLEQLPSIKSGQGEEMSEILTEIGSQLIYDFQLNPSTLSILLEKCRQFPAYCSKVADILATLLLKGELELDTNLESFFVDFFLNQAHFGIDLVRILNTILKNGNHPELSNVIVDKLIESYRANGNHYRLRKRILESLHFLVQDSSKEDMCKILENNLYSDDCAVRRLAFQGLRRINSEYPSISNFLKNATVQILSTGDVQENTEAFKFLNKCTKYCGEEEIQIFETLCSLNKVDYSIFDLPRENWRSALTLLDFTWEFVDSSKTTEKVILFEKLEKLGEKFAWSDTFYEFVFWLRDEGQDNCLSEIDMANILTALSKFECQEIQSLQSMRYPYWKIRIEELDLTMEISNKANILKSNCKSWQKVVKLTQNIRKKLGFETAQILVQKLQKVDDMQRLESLSDLLCNNIDKIKLSSLGVCENEDILLQSIEKHVLVQYLTIKTQLSKSDLIQTQRCLEELHSGSDPDTKIHFRDLIKILEIQDKFGSRESESLMEVIRQISDNCLNPTTYLNVVKVLKEVDWKGWVLEVNKIIQKSKFYLGSTLKSPEDVVHGLAKEMKKGNDGKFKQEMISIIIKVQSGNFQSKFHPHSSNISAWDQPEINRWASTIRSRFTKGLQEMDSEFCTEALTVCKRAFQLHTNFHLTCVQIVSIYCGINKGLKGALLQIATGSGKSTIVAILSVINSLRNQSIDVYTSSPVLAERDARSWAPFYSMFSLTTAHNGDIGVYISGLKQCYTKDIVYGEISQFQFDNLRHSYSDLGTLGQRTAQFAIVDEVDSLLVDDLSKLARLSSPFPGADLLQILYHLVFHRMLTIEKKLFTLHTSIYFVDGHIIQGDDKIPQLMWIDNDTKKEMVIDDLVGYIQNGTELDKVGITLVKDIDKFIKQHLQEFLYSSVGMDKFGKKSDSPPIVKIPQHLRSFVSSQIPKWVDNCTLAYNYKENVHYIVDEGQIKPVDYLTTGIVQGSTSWSDGLHQFLQLKHNLRLTSETCTTNFLSNMSLFKKYVQEMDTGKGLVFCTSNIIGLTGTLGSAETRNALETLYNCKCTTIPLTHHQRYVQYPDIMVATEALWIKEIVASVKSQIARKRGTLVICETIQDAHKLHKAIKQYCPLNSGIRLYTHNNCDQESQIEKIYAGQIIIATNLAGRGTDISTKEIESSGGLHVCLTFLPNNIRVEEQAFGRTSRQGNFGSGQLICTIPFSLIGKSCNIIRESRNKAEDEKLEHFLSKDLQLLTAKDECFKRFSFLLSRVRELFREEKSSLYTATVGVVTNAANTVVDTTKSLFGAGQNEDNTSNQTSQLTIVELNQLQALEERWALLLRQIDDGNIPPSSALDYYTFFEWRAKRDFRFQKGADHSKVIKSPYYHISIGNYYLMQTSKFTDYLPLAKQHFASAVRLDEDISSGALVGLGNLFLKGNPHRNYKTQAIKYLKKAMSLLEEETSHLSTALTLVKQRNVENEVQSELEKQLSTKMSIIGSYSNSVQGTMDATKRSLRPITITGQESKSLQETERSYFSFEFSDDVKQSTKNNLQILKKDKFDTFSLKFEHLTLSQDSGAVDQAVDMIKNVSADVLLECPAISFETLLNLTSEDAYATNLSTKEASAFIDGWISKGPSKISKFLKMASEDLKIDVYEITTADPIGKEVCTKILLEKAKAYFENIKEDKFYNIIARKGNQTHYNVFKSLKIDLEINNLSIDEAKIFISTMKESELRSIGFQSSLPPIIPSTKQKITTFASTFDHETGTKNSSPSWDAGSNNKLYSMNSDKDLKSIAASMLLVVEAECQISLKFHSLKHSEITKNLNALQTIFKTGKIYLRTSLTSSSTTEAIQQLREMGLEFALIFPKLNYGKAVKVIEQSVISQENMELRGVKVLTDLFLTGETPHLELGEYMSRGIFLLFEFSEKSFIPWFSIACVGALAAIQMATGGILVATGFGATVGMGLITEGAADVFTAYRAYSNRQFSWQDYATQKAISLTISAISMGLSSLKDAAKGATLVAESAGKEVVEQASGKFIAEGAKRTLNETVKVAGSNLKVLAVKQIGVSLGEAGLREIGNYGMDQLSKFAMSNIQPQIKDKVESEVTQSFYKILELQRLSRLLFAVNNKQLESKILSVLSDVTGGSLWAKYWQSVGLPLVRGVFSNSQYFLANVIAQAARVATMLNGIREIVYAIEKVCIEILTSIKKMDLSPAKLLQLYCNLTPSDALELAPNISSSIEGNITVFKISGTIAWKTMEQKAQVHSYFTNLNKIQKSFDIKDISSTLQKVVEGLTSHIIKITEAQLVAPVSSWVVGKAVSSISAFVQENVIVNKEQSAEGEPEQKTVSAQIGANAKQFTIAWTQRENFAEVIQSIRGGESKVELDQIPESVQKKALEILFDNQPADGTILIALGEKLGLNLRIVGQDYVPTQQDIESDVKLIIFRQGEVDTNGIIGVGHYDAMDTKTGDVIPIKTPDGSNDCGFETLSYLSDSKFDGNELRKQAAELILTNSAAFEKIMERSHWIESRYPYESNKHLLIGAGDPTKRRAKPEWLDTDDSNDIANRPPEARILKRSGKRLNNEYEGSVEEIVVEASSDAERGTKPNKPIIENTKSVFEDYPGIRKLVSGHIWSERLGGSGTDALNIVEMTKSLNGLYSNKFEKQLIEIKEKFKDIPFTFKFNAKFESRFGLLHNIQVNIGLENAPDHVQEYFNKTFQNVEVGKGTNKEKVYTQNNGVFSTSFYHNPKGKASIREVPSSNVKGKLQSNEE